MLNSIILLWSRAAGSGGQGGGKIFFLGGGQLTPSPQKIRFALSTAFRGKK